MRMLNTLRTGGSTGNVDGAGERSRESLPRDEVFSLLSNQRRRWILQYLKQHEDQQTDLRTLVDTIAATEYDKPVEELSWKKRKRVYTALRQSHLPKLDGAGVIEYDKSRGHVELTSNAREVEMYLEYVPANDIPWSQYYLGLTGIALALLAVTALSVFPFAHLSGMMLATILVTVYGLSAVVHEYHLRQSRLDSLEEHRDHVG